MMKTNKINLFVLFVTEGHANKVSCAADII